MRRRRKAERKVAAARSEKRSKKKKFAIKSKACIMIIRKSIAEKF